MKKILHSSKREIVAKNTISTDFMSKEELQCTSHLLLESDESYEEGSYTEIKNK